MDRILIQRPSEPFTFERRREDAMAGNHVSARLVILLSASFGGCIDEASGPQVPVDLALPARDEGMGGDRDLVALALTAAPCASASECQSSTSGTKKGVCTRSSLLNNTQVQWPGGYCQSPCLARNADPSTGLSSDCPGEAATCMLTSMTGGLCVQSCQSADDCRRGGDYVCATVTGTVSAACIPQKASACDPAGDPLPQGRSCVEGERCVAFSPDNSYGQCATVCDPLAQGCTEEGDVCLVDRDDPKAAGTCIGSTAPTAMDGEPCSFLNSCAAGFQCHAGKCRAYCRTGAAPCPQGAPRCARITNARFDASVLGVCVP